MSRFPAIPPKDLTAEQARTHEVMDQVRRKMGGSFVGKDSKDALVGPFAPLLYAPADIVRPFMVATDHLATDNALSVRERELCILAVCWAMEAEYMTYAHTSICEKNGFSKEQIADALQGRVPQGLEEVEATVYSLARELVGLKGPLPEASWQKAVAVLGREKMILIPLVVGGWSMSSLVLNVADAGLPVEKKL